MGAADAVALRLIREAEHPCPKVTKAKRESSGAIRARCNNGEEYFIATLSNPKHGSRAFALRCKAAKELLNIQC